MDTKRNTPAIYARRSAADERDADASDWQHQLGGVLADIGNRCWTLVVWVVNLVSKPSHGFL